VKLIFLTSDFCCGIGYATGEETLGGADEKRERVKSKSPFSVKMTGDGFLFLEGEESK
jgi:hypothetical protein